MRQNLVILMCSTLLSLASCEATVRVVVPLRDRIVYQYDETLGFRAAPHQDGRWVVRTGRDVDARYHFNAQGFNSPHDYTAGQSPVAAIGDSFVEAIQVDTGEAFPELIATCGTPVYRFAQSGAPLSHYVKLAEEASQYDPRLYVVTLVINDFEPSYAAAGATRVFWHVTRDHQWVAPARYEPLAQRYRPAVVRLFEDNFDMTQRARSAQPDWPGDTPEDVRPLLRWAFGEMQEIAARDGAALLLVMEGDWRALYGESAPLDGYREMVREVAAEMDVAFLDLRPAMLEGVKGGALHIPGDFHWNERGHRVVADAVSEWIAENGCED